ncbi:MAG: hypothetical protein K0R54_3827 [Clostridiaceae bacterium]|jgi:hypothetical protein|nr:hypothetical protein [Clostridiaceae bacterium]
MSMKGDYIMSNKLKVTRKSMERLGIRKTESGDYDYIDASDKNKSKYKSIKRFKG